MTSNWADSHEFAAARVHHPTSVEQLQELVAGARAVHALGTRHSFTDVADTAGDLVSTLSLPPTIEVAGHDGARRRRGPVRRPGAAPHEHGRALATMASLPHISVGGAIATGTHGSGDRTGSLAAAVRGLEVVGADGEVRTVRRGDPDFGAHVVRWARSASPRTSRSTSSRPTRCARTCSPMCRGTAPTSTR